ncbi:MAG TPA: phospholipase D-like domain-containing protein [Aeromicrobium sp.]|nr:phospholipase D-like domain-containing protein [Aeromicrobium sp.]
MKVVAWVLAGWLTAIIVIVVVLMLATKFRRKKRDAGAEPYKHIDPPVTVPIGSGSRATTYTYGEQLFAAMLAAIDSARERILFETYIIKSDAMGRRFKDALVAAAERGVDVYVIYDAFANLVVSPRFLRFPKPIHVLRFPVIRFTVRFLSPRAWGRDHRKILAVDDRVAFVGGYNVGSLYATDWRDTHLRIEGEAVWELVNAFVDFWNVHGPGPRLADEGSPTWDPRVRAHRNVPSQLTYPIRAMYLEAIDRASSDIRLTAAYFLPDRDILAALTAAARRGVRVQLLLPRISNHVVTDWLARGFFSELVAAGVRIHRYNEWMVHAKTMTIDGVWSSVGTANIDRLSLTGNYEINLEVHGPELAAHLTAVFDLDVDNSEVLTAAEWDRRFVGYKACEWLLRPLRPLL